MPRRNQNNNFRGRGQSARGGRDDYRGHGNRGRGGGGRGQGGRKEGPRQDYPHASDEVDYIVQVYPDQTSNGTDLLYSERPLLRPIKFVRATLTPFLFQESDEILQPASESAGANMESDVPTADRVTRVFSNTEPFFPAGFASEDETTETLEEIDFADLGKLTAQVEAGTASPSKGSKHSKNTIVEETFTGVCNTQQPKGTSECNESEQKTIIKSTTITDENTLEQSMEALEVTPNLDDAPNAHRTGSPPPHSGLQITRTTATPATSEYSAILPLLDNDSLDSLSTERPRLPEQMPATQLQTENENLGFTVDTQPTRPSTNRSASDTILIDRTGKGEALGEEDELIVYVAPYPRSGRTTPLPNTMSHVKLPSTSLLTGTSETRDFSKEKGHQEEHSSATDVRIVSQVQRPSLSSISFDFQRVEPTSQPRLPPTLTPSQRKKVQLRAKTKENRASKRRAAGIPFGSLGAVMSETQLRHADERERKDPKWETRRKDDSDIEWGDDDDAGDIATNLAANDVDELSSGLGGMDLDPDVGLNMDAMMSFVKSMSAEGSRVVTIDDIEDEKRMREEDAEETRVHLTESSNSEDEEDEVSEEDLESDVDEEEAAFWLEEQVLIAEPNREVPDGLESGGDDEPPDEEPSTQRKCKDKRNVVHFDEHQDDYSGTRSDSDDDVAEIQARLCATSIHAGRKKGKNRVDYLPEDLQAQWERDRIKKAENKRLRKELLMLASLDPFSQKKGGKKARKMMMAALQEPNTTVDMTTIETQMREFIADIGGRKSIAFPPMKKGIRKAVHELAAAFNLRSDSKGKEPKRYITLTKSTRTGITDERKVRKIMNRAVNGWGRMYDGQKKENRRRMPKHREGDEVGKEAPVVGEGNIGFKMLTTMGWSEGVKIGGETSAGIEVPLTAIIKKSRLGLGATRT
ncbi:hypothetical protein ID866_6341 [Astraeus odoratus]|nr:hypothetical protein ID866_6341 [Astraeus odoratus]